MFFMSKLLLSMSNEQVENPLYFKLEKDNKISYLLGTCHVATYSQLPRELREQFNFNTLVTEIDFQNELAIQGTELYQKFIEDHDFKVYSDESIWNSLNSNQKEKFIRFFKDFYFTQDDRVYDIYSIFIPDELFLSLLASFLHVCGIDFKLYNRAKENHKTSLGLESFQDRLDIGLGKDNKFNYDKNIIDAIKKDVPNFISQAEDIYEFSLNLNMFSKTYIPELDKVLSKYCDGEITCLIAQELPSTLLRNHRWLSKLLQTHADYPDVLFAVGALHVWGEHGVINLLLKEGFQIQAYNLKQKNWEEIRGDFLSPDLADPAFIKRQIFELGKELLLLFKNDLQSKQEKKDFQENSIEIKGWIGKLKNSGTDTAHYCFDNDCLVQTIQATIDYLESPFINLNPIKRILAPLNSVHITMDNSFYAFIYMHNNREEFDNLIPVEQIRKTIAEKIKNGGKIIIDLPIRGIILDEDNKLNEIVEIFSKYKDTISHLPIKRMQLSEFINLMEIDHLFFGKITKSSKKLLSIIAKHIVKTNFQDTAISILDNYPEVTEEDFNDQYLIEDINCKTKILLKKYMADLGFVYLEEENIDNPSPILRLTFMYNTAL